MAGHARKGNVSRWITKTCGHSNLIYSEFHHISSRLFIYRRRQNLLPSSYKDKTLGSKKNLGKSINTTQQHIFRPQSRKVAGVVERAALEMRWPGNWSGGSNPSLSAKSLKESLLSLSFCFLFFYLHIPFKSISLLDFIFLLQRIIISTTNLYSKFAAQ